MVKETKIRPAFLNNRVKRRRKKLKYRPNTSPSLAASSAVQSAASIASLSHGSRVGCVHLGHRVLNICANNHHSLHKYISTRQFLAATETTTAPPPSAQLPQLSPSVVFDGLNWSGRNRFLPAVSATVMFLHHHVHWQIWSFVIVCFVETLLLMNIKPG